MTNRMIKENVYLIMISMSNIDIRRSPIKK